MAVANKDPIDNLYTGLVEQGLYTNSLDEFKKKYSDDTSVDGLYTGLKKLGLYTNSKDDFVNKYFGKKKEPTTEDIVSTAKASKEASALLREYKNADAFNPNAQTKDYSDIKATISEADKKIEDAGYGDMKDDLATLPVVKGVSYDIKPLADLKKNNPDKYDRTISSIRWQGQVYNGAKEKEGDEVAHALLNNALEGQNAPNYESERAATRNAVNQARLYAPDARKDIERDKAYGYGKDLPGKAEAIQSDERYIGNGGNLNNYQVLAMHYLEDVRPDQAIAYDRFINAKGVGKGLEDSKIGFDMKARELERIGKNLERLNLQERLKDNPEDQEAKQKMDTLMLDYQTENSRYPAAAQLDAEQLMKESFKAEAGIGKRFLLGVGEDVGDAMNWASDVLSAPFTSDNDKALNDLELLGDKRVKQLQRYTPENQRLFGSDVIARFPASVENEIQKINNDESLSDEQKQALGRELINKNIDKVEYAPNDKAGKANFTAKSIMATTADVGSTLASQLALSYLTGGLGNVSKARELTTLFGTTFATAYDDYYNQALQENVKNPSTYATVHTTIEAVTELFNDDLAQAKKLFKGKGTVGKILENVTEDQWKAAQKSGIFSKLAQAAKPGIKNAAQESLEEGAGQVLSNAADTYAFDKQTGLMDGVGQTMASTFVGMIPLGGVSLPFQYRDISRNRKYAFYEMGYNPERSLEQVDQQVKDGTLNERQADVIREQVDRAAKAVKVTPPTRTDGSLLTDNEKTDYAFNQTVLQDIKEQSQSAPPQIKEKLEEVKNEIELKQAKILTPHGEKSDIVAENEKPAIATKNDEPVAKEPIATESKVTPLQKEEESQPIALQDEAVQKEEQFTKSEPAKTMNADVTNIDKNVTSFKDKLTKLKEESTEQEKLAATKSWPAFRDKYPDTTVEEYRQMRADGYKKMNGMDKMVDEHIETPEGPQKVDEYLNKAQVVLSALYPDATITPYGESAAYYESEKRPEGSAGVYHPSEQRLALNLELIKKHGAENTIFHEVIHPIVNEAILSKAGALDDVYEKIKQLNIPAVQEHVAAYQGRGTDIQKVEGVTEFLTQVADGKVDLSNVKGSFTTRIIDVVNRIFKAIGVSYRISTATDLKRLSENIKEAFATGDVSRLEESFGSRKENKTAPTMDALKKDDIKSLLRDTSIPERQIIDIYMDVMKVDEDTAKKAIAEARQEVVNTYPKKARQRLDAGDTEASTKQWLKDTLYISDDVAANIVENAKNLPDTKSVDRSAPDAGVVVTDADVKRVQDSMAKGLPTKIKNWVSDLVKKNLTSDRGLGQKWLSIADESKGAKKYAAREARKAVLDLRDALKESGFDEFDKLSQALITGHTANLPQRVGEVISNMRNIIDGYSKSLVNNGYVSPSQALVIEKNIGQYLNRSYKLYTEKGWKKHVPKEHLDEAQKFLTQQHLNNILLDEPGAKDAQERAEKLAANEIQDILTLKKDPKGVQYETINRDVSPLKQREDIPEPIRKLMGEYTDPGTAFIISVSKLAALHSQSEMLVKLKNAFKGEIFFEKNDPNRPEGFNHEIASSGSNTWTPLNGLYTSEYFMDDLQKQQQQLMPFMLAWRKSMSLIKKGKTVWSIPTQTVNFVANIGIAVANGNFDLTKLKEAGKYYKDALFKNERTTNDFLDTAIKHNVIGQSVDLGVIRSMLGKDNPGEFALEEFIKKPPNKLNPITWLKGLDKIAEKQYAASDSFWKIYGFANEVDNWSRAQYGEKYNNLTPEQKHEVESIAAERIKNTYPTYDRVLPALLAFSKNVPFVGNFMAFQAEVYRTVKNNWAYAIRDLRSANPEIKKLGLKRLAGIISYSGIKLGIDAAVTQAGGLAISGLWAAAVGDDDTKRKMLDKFLPEFLETNNLSVRDNGDGIYVVRDIDRLDPYNNTWQMLNALNSGADGGIGKAAGELAKPFIEPDMLASSIIDVLRNKDKRGYSIYNTADEQADQTKDIGAYFWNNVEPSSLKFAKKVLKSDDKSQEILSSLLGGRGYDVDVFKGFNAYLKDAESKIATNKGIAFSKAYSKFADPEDIEKELSKDKENFKRILKELHEVYAASIQLGVPVQKMDSRLKSSFFGQKGKKDMTYAIITGNIPDEVVDEIFTINPR